VKYAEDGYVIKPGDFIESKDFMGVRRYAVHRVTKTFALVRWNEKAEGKFPRVYKSFGYTLLPYRRWNTATFRVIESP
jgi:hypothetical protein